ncbi:MAG TPA: hypothetical protein V6D28_04220 [Leptolyngbyaceae cyanobacterium]
MSKQASRRNFLAKGLKIVRREERSRINAQELLTFCQLSESSIEKFSSLIGKPTSVPRSGQCGSMSLAFNLVGEFDPE